MNRRDWLSLQPHRLLRSSYWRDVEAKIDSLLDPTQALDFIRDVPPHSDRSRPFYSNFGFYFNNRFTIIPAKSDNEELECYARLVTRWAELKIIPADEAQLRVKELQAEINLKDG